MGEGFKLDMLNRDSSKEKLWEHGNIWQFWKGTRELGPPLGDPQITQERVLIGSFYHINHTKTYNFHAPTLLTPAFHKITAKMHYCLSKITAFVVDEDTTLRYRHKMILAIPEFFVRNIELNN